MERDYTTGAGTAIVFNFNSHAHVERDADSWEYGSAMQNFNSHAHVERDGVWDFEGVYAHFISTHTLTWSVTLCLYQTFC